MAEQNVATEETRIVQDDDLLDRAIVGYFKWNKHATLHAPSRTHSYVAEHKGTVYVIVCSRDHVLAIYKLRNSGQLRAVHRPPLSLLKRFASTEELKQWNVIKSR